MEAESRQRDFSAEDATGAVILSFVRGETNRTLRAGTRIRVSGVVNTSAYGHVFADSQEIRELGHEAPPPIRTATLEEILSGKFDARPVNTTGTLKDYFEDEIDPDCLFLILSRSNCTVYVAYGGYSRDDLQFIDSLVGRQLELSAVCDPRPSGMRRKIGRILRIGGLGDIRVRSGSPYDPFSAPVIADLGQLQASELNSLGRRRASGRVLAVWKGHHALIRTASGTVSRIDFAKDTPPRFNESIEVVGFPETDLYRINFSRAIWRPGGSVDCPEPAAVRIGAKMLMANAHGDAAFQADHHGQTVKLVGTVRSLPSIGNEDGRFHIESDGYTLPVDISASPALAARLEIGSEVEVTGVCVMDTENWRPNLVFPHIQAVMLVTRSPEDVVILRSPSWWTPLRLTIVIGSLLAILLGILVWNLSLRALVRKRGLALANEELGRLEADLKVCERTRLAVELHDSIAQNLTGVSMEIDTALRSEEPLPETAARHMGRALRTIDSCRGELRNCLWDLRSQALEEEDMNNAIRMTLGQTVGRTELSIRFNVPRSRFTDNTAHTILRIIRELAANAVRHGQATEIKVAGSIEDGVLKFSVRDNGRGFDPEDCPGVLEGHFGLQGVRERVASFEGEMKIESTPGKGTRISVAINIPQTEDSEKL